MTHPKAMLMCARHGQQFGGEGIQHISYEMDDIEKEVEVLRGQGVQFVTPKPYPNAHKNLVIFIHPKCTNGVLTELIQFVGKKHE